MPQNALEQDCMAYRLLTSIEDLRAYLQASALKSAKIKGNTGTILGP